MPRPGRLFGPLYGSWVYAVMNSVVVPLSAVPGPRGSPAPVVWITGVLAHMFLIELPIALAAGSQPSGGSPARRGERVGGVWRQVAIAFARCPQRKEPRMAETEYRASSAVEQADAYIAALFSALGSRDPSEVLREMPAVLRAAVSGLSASQAATPERAGKWSVRQAAQHLADAELVGAFRYRMVMAHDQPTLPGYDQDLWAERLRYEESDLETALGDFATLRRANLRLLDRATPEELRRVMRHPERGDESIERSMRLYAGHDIVHLRQIARIRAAIGAPAAPSLAAG